MVADEIVILIWFNKMFPLSNYVVLVGKCGKWEIRQAGKNPASKNTVNRGTVYTGFPTVSGKKKF